MSEHDLDDIEQFTAKETAHALPGGWLFLFFGLIAWGAWYLWAFSPWGSSWTQGGEFVEAARQAGDGSGSNIFMTILFTALPTLAAIAIVFAQKNRKK